MNLNVGREIFTPDLLVILHWMENAIFNIVIRTVLYRNGRYYLGVGGGITADSDPGAEYEETRDKAKAILSALQ